MVVYIAGWGRSGSTLVGNLLGELPDVVSVGEMRYLFHPGVTCGCGSLVADCCYWQTVTTRAEAEIGPIDDALVLRLQQRALTPKHVPALLRRLNNEAVQMATITQALYNAAAAEAGARVVVDTSKHPADAALVAAMPEGRVVHLIRDPRAAAFSWSRRRRRGQLALSLTAATARWTEWNLLTDLTLWRVPWERRLRIRYEDFAAKPRVTLRRIASMADVDRQNVDSELMTGNSTFQLGENHNVNGNPSMFVRGTLQVATDEDWRSGLSRTEATLIMAATWPLMLRYGYVPLLDCHATARRESS